MRHGRHRFDPRVDDSPLDDVSGDPAGDDETAEHHRPIRRPKWRDPEVADEPGQTGREPYEAALSTDGTPGRDEPLD